MTPFILWIILNLLAVPSHQIQHGPAISHAIMSHRQF